MQQTLLAIVALFAVAVFTLNQNRSVIRSYNELVDDEMEIAASAVATHILELIGNRSFDSRTSPDQVKARGMTVGSNELTMASAFGTPSGCDLDEPFRDATPCSDIDDVDMATGEWQNVPFHLKDGKELPFDVNVQVFYVDPPNLDVPLPDGQTSQFKKVVVTLRTDRHVRQHRYENGFVRVERIFSYDSRRAENRLKEKYGVPALANVSPPDPAANPPVDPTSSPSTNPAPDTAVVCHRRVRKRKVVWTTKTVKQKFLARHIGHGDKAGAC